MKLKLDHCRTCRSVNFYEFEGDGLTGHFPVAWCTDCGTLHKHYYGDTDWTWKAPPEYDVRLSFAEKMVRERLEDYDRLMHMIDEAGFTVASGKLEPKTYNIAFPSMKRTALEACGDVLPAYADAQGEGLTCTKPKGHEGAHWAKGTHMEVSWPQKVDEGDVSADARAFASMRACTNASAKVPPGAVELKVPAPTVFEHDLEVHRKAMEDDMRRYTGQHASAEVRRIREAVWFLLAVVHQPGEPRLEARIEKFMREDDQAWSDLEKRLNSHDMLSEVVNMFIHARGPGALAEGELKEVLKAFQRRLLGLEPVEPLIRRVEDRFGPLDPDDDT